MPNQIINENSRAAYIDSLKAGKSKETVIKYKRDLGKFQYFLDNVLSDGNNYSSDMLTKYQEWLIAEGFSYRSVNAYVSIAYQLCLFLDISAKPPKSLRPEVKVVDNSNLLTATEYQRLVKTAYKCDMEQTGMLIQVVSGTPLQYEELRFVTAEVVNGDGLVELDRNGVKIKVQLSEQLKKALKEYIDLKGIESGCVFVTSAGTFPLRTNVFRGLKRLCRIANVDEEKVSIQKIRKAFTKDFYAINGKKIK